MSKLRFQKTYPCTDNSKHWMTILLDQTKTSDSMNCGQYPQHKSDTIYNVHGQTQWQPSIVHENTKPYVKVSKYNQTKLFYTCQRNALTKIQGLMWRLTGIRYLQNSPTTLRKDPSVTASTLCDNWTGLKNCQLCNYLPGRAVKAHMKTYV